jgi:hypothetical protein
MIATDCCGFLLMLVQAMGVQGHFVLHKISDHSSLDRAAEHPLLPGPTSFTFRALS